VCWSSRNGTADEPLFDRCSSIYISRRPLGWTGGDMSSFSRVRSTQLLASWLVLVLSLVCAVLMESIVWLPPTCCLLYILLASFVWPLLLLRGIGNFWVIWYIRIARRYCVPLVWLLCQPSHCRVPLCGPWPTEHYLLSTSLQASNHFSNLFHQEAVVFVVLKRVQSNLAVSECCCRDWVNALPVQHF